MTDTAATERRELERCPWCGAHSDEVDAWGFLVTHEQGCYWTNIHGDPIGRVLRVNFSDVERWNTRVNSVVALEAEMERNVMIETINALEAERDALKLHLDRILQCFRNGAMPARDIIEAAEAVLGEMK
jgi:hypothetical protein